MRNILKLAIILNVFTAATALAAAPQAQSNPQPTAQAPATQGPPTAQTELAQSIAELKVQTDKACMNSCCHTSPSGKTRSDDCRSHCNVTGDQSCPDPTPQPAPQPSASQANPNASVPTQPSSNPTQQPSADNTSSFSENPNASQRFTRAQRSACGNICNREKLSCHNLQGRGRSLDVSCVEEWNTCLDDCGICLWNYRSSERRLPEDCPLQRTDGRGRIQQQQPNW